MTTVPKVVSLLAISAALTLSGSHVFAKTVGPGSGEDIRHFCRPLRRWRQPEQYIPLVCHQLHPGGELRVQPRGPHQPPCRGGHMGPNGVMIQCK